jgi:hypothetical protein
MDGRQTNSPAFDCGRNVLLHFGMDEQTASTYTTMRMYKSDPSNSSGEYGFTANCWNIRFYHNSSLI